MKITKNLIIALFAATAIFLAGCSTTSGASDNSKKTETPTTGQKLSLNRPFGIADDEYQALLDISLISKGNNYRLKKVIQKLRAGEDVYIAALGGSVTEGAGPANFKDGYAYQFNNKLKEKYTPNNGANVHFDGAGLSGTPSSLGLTRYQSDVVDVLGVEPDLLIIEFAVNDDGSEQATRAFEALIRNALLANKDTAVIALYSAATYGNTAQNKKPVAEFYGVPQINVLDLFNYGVGKGYFTKNPGEYYADNVHPTKSGHELQADAIMNLFAAVDASSDDAESAVPENWCKPKPLTNFTRIFDNDKNVKITKGSFSGTDTSTQGIKKTNKGNFPKNWYHDSGDESFKMEINCKSLIFTYKEQGSWLSKKFGKAEIYVDGKLKATYDGGKAGGWCNCVPVFLIDEAETSKHTVEVKMASGEESKGFTIVALGYSY